MAVNAGAAVVDCECFGTMPNRNVPKRQFDQKQFDHVEPLVPTLTQDAVVEVVAVDVDNSFHGNPVRPIKNPPFSGFFALNEALQAATGKGES